MIANLGTGSSVADTSSGSDLIEIRPVGDGVSWHDPAVTFQDSVPMQSDLAVSLTPSSLLSAIRLLFRFDDPKGVAAFLLDKPFLARAIVRCRDIVWEFCEITGGLICLSGDRLRIELMTERNISRTWIALHSSLLPISSSLRLEIAIKTPQGDYNVESFLSVLERTGIKPIGARLEQILRTLEYLPLKRLIERAVSAFEGALLTMEARPTEDSLVLFVRREQYVSDFVDRLDAFNEENSADLSLLNDVIFITTDFQSPNKYV